MDKSKITIKDIAKSLNLSIGTVDRALHDRGRISEETRTKILLKIQELGYTPNALASALSRKSSICVGFVSPAHNYFFQDILRGVQTACEEMRAYSIELKCCTQNEENDPISQLEDLKEFLHNDLDGVILAPLHPELLTDCINGAVDRGIRVITVNMDAPNSKRLCYVGQDSYHTGAIIGSIFGKFLRGEGDVALLSARSDTLALKERREGFVKKLAEDFPAVRVMEGEDYINRAEAAYEVAKTLLKNNPEIKGVFASSTQGAIGVGMAIKEMNKAGGVISVGYDTQEETREMIKSNTLLATLTQNPFSQGYYAAKLMNKVILEGYQPDKEHYYTRPDVLIDADQFDSYRFTASEDNIL